MSRRTRYRANARTTPIGRRQFGVAAQEHGRASSAEEHGHVGRNRRTAGTSWIRQPLSLVPRSMPSRHGHRLCRIAPPARAAFFSMVFFGPPGARPSASTRNAHMTAAAAPSSARRGAIGVARRATPGATLPPPPPYMLLRVKLPPPLPFHGRQHCLSRQRPFRCCSHCDLCRCRRSQEQSQTADAIGRHRQQCNRSPHGRSCRN